MGGPATGPDSGAVVRSAVGHGHKLGLLVVAEGLQGRAAEAILLEAGCDAAQGFLIGRPADESEATQLLMEHAGLAEPVDVASGEVAAAAQQGHPVDLETA